MIKIFAKTLPPDTRLKAYMESWYSASKVLGPKARYGIKISDNDLILSAVCAEHYGIKIIDKDHEKFYWTPPVASMGSYDTNAYLVEGSIAIIKSIKEKAKEIKSFPHQIISLVAQNQEAIEKSALRIHLPLERIVIAKEFSHI